MLLQGRSEQGGAVACPQGWCRYRLQGPVIVTHINIKLQSLTDSGHN